MERLETARPTRSGTILVVLIALALLPSSASGQEAGENIQTVYGFLSEIPGTGEPRQTVTLDTPALGKDYEIKVYFLKAEVSATLIDAYYDSANRQDGEDSGSLIWDKIRDQTQRVESEARYEVLDARGNSIGKVTDIGLVPLFKNIKFRGASASYTVKIECVKGAGLFRLVFEFD